MSAWGYEPYYLCTAAAHGCTLFTQQGVAPTLESSASHGKNIHNSDAAGCLRRLGRMRCLGQRWNGRRVRRSLRQWRESPAHAHRQCRPRFGSAKHNLWRWWALTWLTWRESSVRRVGFVGGVSWTCVRGPPACRGLRFCEASTVQRRSRRCDRAARL